MTESNKTLRTSVSSQVKDKTDKYILTTFKPLTDYSQRVCTAVYMVTDCMEREDPIKYQLREMSLSLLKSVSELSLKSIGQTYASFTDISQIVAGLINHLKLCVSIGYISDMNYSVLRAALDKFDDEITKRQSMYVNSRSGDITLKNLRTEEFVLPKNIFNMSFDKSSQAAETSVKSNKFVKDNIGKKDITKDKSFDKRQVIPVRPRTSYSGGDERRNKILSIIRVKGQVGIKDITAIITDISPKTIQRELNDLIRDNKIKREGSKRWSTYSLVN